MLKHLDGWSAGAGPLHDKLAGALRRLVDDGRLPPGSRLPSERALARRLVVSRSTVVAAYRTLTAAGVAASRHGSGTYVAGSGRAGPATEQTPHATPILRRLLAGGPDPEVISFAVSGVPPSALLADAVAGLAGADLVDLLAASGYQPLGVPGLRLAVAAAMSRAGLPTSPDQLVTTTGAHQALHLCASVLVRPGEWVAVEDPVYPGCIDAFAAAGARLAAVDVDSDGLVPESLEAVLRSRPLSAVCVTPTFHNPTGAMLAPHRRRRIAELLAASGIPLVEDNSLAYASWAPVSPPPPVAAQEGAGVVFTVGSASKLFWPGLRVGWIRAPEPWLGRLARRKVAADLGSGVLDQAIAARMFGVLDAVRAGIQARLAEGLDVCRAALVDGFEGWRWSMPAGGASLWVDVGADAERFAQVALRHGVEVVAGNAFSPLGRWGDHLRVPLGLEPVVLDEALRRLRRAWTAYRPEAAAAPRQGEPELVV